MEGVRLERHRLDTSSCLTVDVDLLPAPEEDRSFRMLAGSIRHYGQCSGFQCIVRVEKLDKVASGGENTGIACRREALIILPNVNDAVFKLCCNFRRIVRRSVIYYNDLGVRQPWSSAELIASSRNRAWL